MVKITRAKVRLAGFDLDYDFSLSFEDFRKRHGLSYRAIYHAALREYIEKREGPVVDVLPKLGTYPANPEL
jgi:hypothetical protein